jgi:guanyl-specific ribonuclease Sa
VSVWTVIALCAGGVAVVGCAVWVGRNLQKGSQAKAVEEARQRMDAVASSNLPSTAARLRNSRF